jgi:outer membrane protein assembly factor BamB
MAWYRTLGKRILYGVAIAAVALAALIFVFKMHFEVDGSGARPLVSFGDRNARLEESRARQPAPTPAAAVDAATLKIPPVGSAYWTDFRGPLRDGHYTQTPVSANWPASGLERLWKQPIGGGYASFVIAQGRAFTIEQRRANEAVTAYDMATGRELWAHTYPADFRETMGGEGPRATPTYHNGLVYSLGATGEFRVLDVASGKLQWSRNIVAENGAELVHWAMAASPLIVDDTVVVQPGGRKGASMVAYNRLTGKPVWKSLDDRQAYTTPMLVTLAGQRQILTVTAERAVGLRPEDGALLWDYPWTTEYDANAAMPLVVDQTHFFISAGYGHGAALVEVARAGEKFSARTVWKSIRMKNKFSASVLHEGYIYGLDEAILACLDAKTGELKWKGGRYGYGQLLLAQGHLLVTTESGEVALVEATPTAFTELARFQAIKGKTWNVPAISDGLLLVRNESEMACFRLR